MVDFTQQNMGRPNTPEEDKLQGRYLAALHAVQTGVAALLQLEPDSECNPKHLRVGVNSSLQSTCALAELMTEKGLITREEYLRKLAECTEREVRSYEQRISMLTGKTIKLL